MIKKIKPKSEFTRNVLTLMTGTTVAQAIPVAISPILSRIYTPDDFGVLALYMAISSIIAVIATGRYELAIMLPKKNSDAEALVALSLAITLIISLCTLIVVLIFNESITNLLGNPEISYWLYFVPLTVFITGLYQSLRYWSNRQKRYKNLAACRVTQNTVASGIQIGLGLEGLTAYGLISGNILGQGIASLVLVKMVRNRNRGNFRIVGFTKILALLRRYKKLPLYSMPMGLVNTISNQIKPLVFTTLFSGVVVGWIFMAERVLRTPLSILASAFSSVFFQKFVNSKNKRTIYLKSYFFLLFFSLIILSPVYFWGELIFEIIFGSAWVKAGEIASIMYPMICFSFAAGAISTVFTALEKNEVSLIWQLIYFSGLIYSIIEFSVEGYILLIQYLVYWGSSMYFILFILGLYHVFQDNKN